MLDRDLLARRRDLLLHMPRVDHRAEFDLAGRDLRRTDVQLLLGKPDALRIAHLR